MRHILDPFNPFICILTFALPSRSASPRLEFGFTHWTIIQLHMNLNMDSITPHVIAANQSWWRLWRYSPCPPLFALTTSLPMKIQVIKVPADSTDNPYSAHTETPSLTLGAEYISATITSGIKRGHNFPTRNGISIAGTIGIQRNCFFLPDPLFSYIYVECGRPCRIDLRLFYIHNVVFVGLFTEHSTTLLENLWVWQWDT